MHKDFSEIDNQKLQELIKIRNRNNDYSWLVVDYLNNTPRLITKELMQRVDEDGILSEKVLFSALLSGFLDLDAENNEEDNVLETSYLHQSVKKLDPTIYLSNSYYRHIKIPKISFANWKLTYDQYDPYEAFIYKDIVLTSDYHEIPQIGFFDKSFRFPVVMENNYEWMAIKPNEIETMQSVIDQVNGRVLTFGLGMGYFPYMVSLKENVSSVTIVEKDKEVIRLFREIILPQFQHKEKVEIINADAFEYAMKKLPNISFDSVFVDLWHDVSDGLELYLKMKKLEYLSERTRFFYWIEDSLLSGLRWQLFDVIISTSSSFEEIEQRLSNKFLQELASSSIK
ncbi:MAG: hypothetical protein PHY69_04095 [Dysgonamonadaceae bacterium]|nr:hypothetical protein [Dysgonamonadaceae bacterium]MDD3309127.1 hypothetical protein [Dysgonamonadaceae bacterium]MDD3900660.1 hypothetical protein [Dysgonamonadaceae bacterium]MDD4397940.1 hypothetical protein [Dysgonamonadaceae bacterium]